MSTDHSAPVIPFAPPVVPVWRSISAAQMANVETVEARTSIAAGGVIHCEVVAHFWTAPPGGAHYLASETVYVIEAADAARAIAAGNRAASLFRDACALLARVADQSEPLAPAPQPTPLRA